MSCVSGSFELKFFLKKKTSFLKNDKSKLKIPDTHDTPDTHLCKLLIYIGKMCVKNEKSSRHTISVPDTHLKTMPSQRLGESERGHQNEEQDV